MAVPVHTPIRTPGSSAAPSHAGPATPHQPGLPQASPGTPNHQQHPHQDSLQDIRSDLDHHPGGLSEPDPTDQQALADAVPHNEDGTPQRFPDPFGSWSQLQNDGGNTVPGRSNNCADCSRSFLETWYGNPQVSAPRTLDTDEHGNPDVWSPENSANDNQIRWTGAAHTYAGPGNNPETANNIADTLRQAGPGSAAIVQVNWVGGGGHAFNVVNHNGNIVWVDTQSGQVSHDPLHLDKAEHVWHIPLDADRNPIDTTQPQAEDSEGQNDESQSQNDDESQPQNSANDGQPEKAHNDVAGDDTDTGTNSPKPTDPTTPDASNNADAAQPSTAGPNQTPDPTGSEPRDENSRPQSEGNDPSEPHSTPDGRDPSQTQQSPETPSEQNRPSPTETPSTPDQQSHPNEATRPDEQGHTPDKESEQPTAPKEHGQPPIHATPDSTGNGTPDKGTVPARTATDSSNEATTSRDTPRQTTTPSNPRTPLPHQRTTEPRAADPDTTDPRTSDPRTSDPRASGPHRDTPTQQRPETNERPDRHAPAGSGGSDRRAPAEPAGTSQNPHSDTNGEDPHPKDDPARKDHPRLSERESDTSTHYGMAPMEDQAELRRTNNVRQVDLDPVHQQLNAWLTPVPDEDGSGTRIPLVDALQSCSPPRPDDPDHKPTILRHDDLARILPGFADMHPGERGAVVASLARLSHNFHASHAVGASPEPRDDYASRGEKAHAGASWKASHRDDPELKEAIQEEFSGIAKALEASGEHRPDFTGRNYAAVEVYDPVSKQITYMTDSSYPNPDGKHSEKNLLDYLKEVNEGRAEGDSYQPLSMYSDREPCGHGQGYANCAKLLSDEMRGVDVFYGTGYRKNADIVEPDLTPEGGYKKQFDRDLAENLAALGKVWVRAMGEGGLKNTTTV